MPAKNGGVTWTVFGVIVAFLCGLCIAVGLLVYYFGCPNKVSSEHGAPTTPTPMATINYRLPRSLRPTKYELSIQPYFPAGPQIVYESARNFTFDGNVTIRMECMEETDKITMHMYKINVHNQSIHLVDTTDGHPLAISGHSYDKKTHFVTFYVSAGNVLQVGHLYELQVGYTGQLVGSDLAGFYPSSYVENGQVNWLVVTQFEPTDARRALPCFDEPSYKAIFEVKMTHPAHMKALSNGMEVESVDLGNGWNVTRFEPTKRMSSYLLAFAVCAFQAKTKYTKDGKTLFRVWARPSLINETEYAVNAGPKVLDHYAEYFNISFPLQKQDMLAIPDFSAGAMENWGLVTYRERELLYDPNVYASTNRQRVAAVIAHELSHQWFGDLVTMAWWDDLWLNEGFARYMEYVGSDFIADGAFRMDQQFIGNLDSAMKSDQVSTSHPIFVNVSTPDEINAIFDDISYNKGASILRMLNYTISEEIFKKGLHNYLHEHQYDNANHNDLWRALSQAVNGTKLDWNSKPLNISEYMNPWIMQMGYPILNVVRTSDNQVIVTQERYLLSSNQSVKSHLKFQSSPFNYTWYVPVWYQSEGNKNVSFAWLKPSEPLHIQSPNLENWLLVNYEAAGYFRVNYDRRNWILLINQLTNNHKEINIKNRAQLLDDAFNLARAGYLDYGTTLNLTRYLSKETSYIPWQAAMNGFGFLEDMLVLSAAYQYYRDYLLALMMPMYEETGWTGDESNKDDVLEHYRRALSKSVQCQLGYPDCLKNARDFFRNFASACGGQQSVSSKCSKVPNNIRKTVYCAGGSSGDAAWWNLLWELHEREQVAIEKDNLMYGLCCTRSPSMLTRLLDEAIDPNSTVVRRQDSRYVFSYISSNDIGRVLLWEYLEENWPTISTFARSGSGSGLRAILTAATGSFNTEFQAKMLEDFYEANMDQLGPASTTLKQQIERVNANVEWMNKYRDDVVRWLKAQTSAES